MLHYFLYFFICLSLGLHPQHMEFPRLGVKLELQVLVYTTATAVPDLSYICDIQHSSQIRQTINPLNKARYWAHVLMDASQFHYHCATTEFPFFFIFILLIQDCYGYFEPIWILRSGFQFLQKKQAEILIGITLEFVDQCGAFHHFDGMKSSIHGHKIYFHLFIPSL